MRVERLSALLQRQLRADIDRNPSLRLLFLREEVLARLRPRLRELATEAVYFSFATLYFV